MLGIPNLGLARIRDFFRLLHYDHYGPKKLSCAHHLCRIEYDPIQAIQHIHLVTKREYELNCKEFKIKGTLFQF